MIVNTMGGGRGSAGCSGERGEKKVREIGRERDRLRFLKTFGTNSLEAQREKPTSLLLLAEPDQVEGE